MVIWMLHSTTGIWTFCSEMVLLLGPLCPQPHIVKSFLCFRSQLRQNFLGEVLWPPHTRGGAFSACFYSSIFFPSEQPPFFLLVHSVSSCSLRGESSSQAQWPVPESSMFFNTMLGNYPHEWKPCGHEQRTSLCLQKVNSQRMTSEQLFSDGL
jgi:hypothetical protein